MKIILKRFMVLIALFSLNLGFAEIIYPFENTAGKKKWDKKLNEMLEKSLFFSNIYDYLKASNENFSIVWGNRDLVAKICKSNPDSVLHGCFTPKSMSKRDSDEMYHAIVFLIENDYAVNARTGETYELNTFRSEVIFNELFHAAQYAYSMTTENYLDYKAYKGGRGSVNLTLAETETDFAQIVSEINIQPIQLDMINSMGQLRKWIQYFDDNSFPLNTQCKEWSIILKEMAAIRKSDPYVNGKAYQFKQNEVDVLQWHQLKTFMFLYPECGVICRCSVIAREKQRF